jgi:predicted transcriptional regulator of viral defense system
MKSTGSQLFCKSSDFFSLRPVFRTEEFRRACASTAKRGSRANLLNYFVRQGRILPLCRGAYAVVPPGQSAQDDFKPSRYLVAAVLRPDVVLAYHTALEVLGHAHTTSRVLYCLSSRPAREVTWDQYAFNYVGYPKSFLTNGHQLLGVVSLEIAGATVRVTGPERTLVDCLTCLNYAGGAEEALVSLRGFPLFDFPLLEQCLTAVDNSRVSAAVGAFLEQEGQRLFVPQTLLSRLERHRPGYRTYLERSQRGGVFLKRWNLIVPRVFIQEDISIEI